MCLPKLEPELMVLVEKAVAAAVAAAVNIVCFVLMDRVMAAAAAVAAAKVVQEALVALGEAAPLVCIFLITARMVKLLIVKLLQVMAVTVGQEVLVEQVALVDLED
jgi:hypothetical protein